MRPRSVDRVREDLLHNGVAAVVGLGLSQWEQAVGEHRVVPVGGEQLALPMGGAVRVQAADPASATIPTTSAPIFNPAFAPTLAATRTCRRARSSRPMFRASRTDQHAQSCTRLLWSLDAYRRVRG